MRNKLCIVLCENFRNEIKAVLDKSGFDDVEYRFFSAKCHTRDSRLDLSDIPLEDNGSFDSTIVIGGCCIENATDDPKSGIHFVHHKQCFNLLTNITLAEHFQAKGSYLTTPGWVSRWKDIIRHWGMNREVCHQLFSEISRNILMFDSGVWDKSADNLSDFAEYAELPFESLPVGIDFFRTRIEKLIIDWRITFEESKRKMEFNELRGQLAENKMGLELINDLAHTYLKQDVIDKIEMLFTTLFSPGKFILLLNDELRSTSDDNDSELSRIMPLFTGNNSARKDFIITDSQKGFVIALKTENDTLGYILIDELQFPQYLNYYLNLSLSISSVCTLAIQNATLFNDLNDKNIELDTALKDLRKSLDEIKNLREIIPICSHCKNIRNDNGYWEQVEQYFTTHTESKFSHGICPDCMIKYYSDLYTDEELKKMKN